MRTLPTAEDEFEKKAIDDIEKHGVHILGVFDPGGNEPNFSYSLGLWYSFEHPEILIYGLDTDVSKSLINAIADKCRAGESKIVNGLISSDFLQNFDVQFIDVLVSHYKEHLGWARWLYRGNDFPALQMVFPDKDGNWPWSNEASDDFKWFQPVLGEFEKK